MPKSSRVAIAAICAAALAWPASAPAFESREFQCQTIRRVEGGYTFRVEPGLSVRALVAAPGPFVHTLGSDVVAFSCFSEQPLPEVDDVEVLQAGYDFNLASPHPGLLLIHLSLENGRVRYEVYEGSLSDRERRSLDSIVARMQARVGAPQP